MANMGYCRFRNTLSDLWDCYDHIADDELSEAEDNAREALVKLCQDIVRFYGPEEEDDDD